MTAAGTVEYTLETDPLFARPDVVGRHEARELLGVSHAEFRRLRKVDPQFPLPTPLRSGPVWSGEAFLVYVTARKRLWGGPPS